MSMFNMSIPNWNIFKRNKKIKKITLGICAMAKKAESKPMKEMLSRLPEELFDIKIFGDECILNQPIETWPVVEVLIAFYSTKFPTKKALEYVKLRKPYMINDLAMEDTLKDRRKVYRLLQEQGIDVPTHVFLEREDPTKVNTVEEYDEYIVVNGVHINKPLVEKPVDAEDHNIYIYYPMSAGGGSKRLFRKIDDRSSEFYPTINDLRTEGSYIYEEFVVTQGTDVKVYTVGPDYGHAEARKSPVVDGRVKRDGEGLEVRYPVILSSKEKDIARKIVLAFGQIVCGFDILRVQGKSYCCDVNGFSFVKNSRKYYDDASQILKEIMLNKLRPEYQSTLSTRAPLLITREHSTKKEKDRENNWDTKEKEREREQLRDSKASSQSLQGLVVPFSVEGPYDTTTTDDDRAPSPAPSLVSLDSMVSSGIPQRKSDEELRCVVAIIRHADRTPKQKMKISVTLPQYLDYFHFYAKSPRKDLKVKSKTGLVKFLEVTREIINSNILTDEELRKKLVQIRDVLERWEISGINRKLQMKPQKWAEEDGPALEVVLILKWGGDITPLGREQAEMLGAQFRHNMYPDTEGGGVLRLHSTYRHDLKIKASDEGRVMKTAAAFTKGLLELEGQLTPILASLVTIEEKNRCLLDRGGNFEIKADMDRCKNHLNLLQVDAEMTDELVQQIAPGCNSALRNSLRKLGNPWQSLKRMHELIGGVCSQLENRISQSASVSTLSSCDKLSSIADCESTSEKETAVHSVADQSTPSEKDTAKGNTLYLSETFGLMLDRWSKLNKEFFSAKTSMFDLTKVPDVYDMIRYDMLHNAHLQLSGTAELLKLAAAFENSVVPQEYGTDGVDKRFIGSKMCGALLEKIEKDLTTFTSSAETDDMHYKLDHTHAEDLRINSLGRCVRTRLYFTSESHLHTLLNVFRYSTSPQVICKEGLEQLDEVAELSYLTQIVIRLFEDRSDPCRFHCEMFLSPGITANDNLQNPTVTAPYLTLCRNINCDDLVTSIRQAIDISKTSKMDEQIQEALDNSAETSEKLFGVSEGQRAMSYRRGGSISVSVDEIDGTSDKWERSSSFVPSKKQWPTDEQHNAPSPVKLSKKGSQKAVALMPTIIDVESPAVTRTDP